MERASFITLPRSGVVLTLIVGLGLAAFFLLTLLPNHHALKRLEQESAALKARIQEQAALLPVYRKFYQVIDGTRPEKISRLPFPAPQDLSPEQAAGIETVFRGMAEASGLQVRQVSPELNAIINESRDLRLVITATGSLDGIRRFLLKLGELPFLARVERFRIQQAGPRGDLELSAQVQLAQAVGGG
jgi:Tfp pilus assembly protein PilO